MLSFKIKIAGIIMAFESEERCLKRSIFQKYFKGFAYCGAGKPEVVFKIKTGKPPDYPEKNVVFFNDLDRIKISSYQDKLFHEYSDTSSAGTEWFIEMSQDMRNIIIYHKRKERLSPEEHRLARISQKQMQEFLRREERNSKQRRDERMPNGPGLDIEWRRLSKSERLGHKVAHKIRENILQNFLRAYSAKYKIGLLVHSACVGDNGKGYMFLGKSQTGKSTMARIWREAAGANVFNDDRGLLRPENGGTYFYNLPWTGAYRDGYRPSFRHRAKINGIFFIFHENRNVLKPLAKKKASVKLFQNAFLASWNPEDTTASLALAAEITRTAPCYELGFVNDGQVVQFIRSYVRA